MTGTQRARRRRWPAAGTGLSAAALALALTGCAGVAEPADDGRVSVVTTTGILADLARHVGGDLVDVESLVPEGGDPHSYEPSLRDIRDIVYADAAFSNYLMLEEQNLIRALDANLPADVPNVPLAERAVAYAAEIIPLVENVNLDTIWLGLRVRGTGESVGATRSSEVRLKATGLEGPGDLIGYLTETFGEPTVFFDSSDGFDAGDGYEDDTAVLPPAAHTHMSWAFTEPGVYRLDVAAEVVPTARSRPVPQGRATITFAVGVDPHSVPGMAGATVLDGGHADVTVDLDAAARGSGDSLLLTTDAEGDDGVHPAARTVVEVPNKAITEVPGDPRFRMLGRAGEDIHQLPQAVLGRHVHGEIDPHLWQNVRNAMAYVKIIRDVLTEIDPEHAADYRANASAYLAELEALDAYVTATIAEIPASRRHLVTTHDAFGYLGAAYDVSIAGFVTPNPATEPSLAERRRLSETIANLSVPAVFLEPNLRSRSSTLVQVAEEQGVEVCTIYGDAFDEEVTDYVEMMRANADSLRACLG
ncbi:anchored repeat ABC transporter, substrate-binding protein [Streptomyces marincola]|uniref:anchored repeat ABC transporter, substrate-binding protein n=1 Tax=Streptomyces marincola TaxID=2878388 RepID=UPI001CF42228|nr:anchored repeat ABC transporter, substrate-binding protein [Streptomyces marincola]UCM89767.1 anchored repeat ABC transporter, substrate-binding protein [Streptomyces marincola]